MYWAIILLKLVLFWNLQHKSDGQSTSNFFRNDYKFLEGPQSFYKIHTLHRTWEDAKKRCVLEGASLFYPEDQAEADAVLEFWEKTQKQFFKVFIGISDSLVKGVFETFDGRPLLDVYNNWGPGEPNNHNNDEGCLTMRDKKDHGWLNDDKCHRAYPFICKKELLSLEWNVFCDLPDLSYQYDKENGKCYKFHLTPLNWTDAYSVCSAEQSYLAIINSDKEAEHLVQLTANSGKEKIKGNFLSGAVHLGYHNRNEDGWKTIKHVPLAESGYSKWGNKQPDGGENETCGTMFYNGNLNDLGCFQKCFFICEYDITLLNVAIDEKFGK